MRSLNLASPKRSAKKKKKGKFSALYWIIVLGLCCWMIYLNVNVLFEYQGANEKYSALLSEYEQKKRELEEKMSEFERLRIRLDENGLQQSTETR